MKYLKQFESKLFTNINGDITSWAPGPDLGKEDSPYMGFTKLEINHINNLLFKYNSRDIHYHLVHKHGFHLSIHKVEKTIHGKVTKNIRIFWINKKEDEWFILTVPLYGKRDQESYICDQMDGLIACMESILVDKLTESESFISGNTISHLKGVNFDDADVSGIENYLKKFTVYYPDTHNLSDIKHYEFSLHIPENKEIITIFFTEYNKQGYYFTPEKIAWFKKKEDEWFYLSYGRTGSPKYFSCDQITGLFECLDSILKEVMLRFIDRMQFTPRLNHCEKMNESELYKDIEGGTDEQNKILTEYVDFTDNEIKTIDKLLSKYCVTFSDSIHTQKLKYIGSKYFYYLKPGSSVFTPEKCSVSLYLSERLVSGLVINKNRILWITKKEDEWFLLTLSSSASVAFGMEQTTFLCDQIDGLLECLEAILKKCNHSFRP